MTCESVCWVNIFAIALSRASPCPVCEGVRGGGMRGARSCASC